jgi:GntR family transcriptional regulator/MocR family aminotransferase
VVPSHQFPLGGVLPIQRRLQLLRYAGGKGALVIEDDYDSEFRYRGEPVQSLRHLAPDLVVSLGSFSKILAPGLRLGFMIVPDRLRERVCRLKEDLNMRTPPLEQLALARFIADRALDRHVFKMKRIYQRKRACLIEALGRAFGDRVRIRGDDAGLHLLLEFVDRSFRQADLERLAERGVKVEWVEDYACRKGLHRNRLVLGYGGLQTDRIRAGVLRLKAAIDER